jgi:DNA-binding SARP family transcriptional activator
MDPILHIQLLGMFQLRYGDRAVPTVNSARLQSLLAFVLLHRPTPIARQQLAALFWPATSETQARTNLRNLIHQLRQALPFPDAYL